MRLFIASTFPDAVLHDLNDRVTRVKPRLPAASWMRTESQHLTFAFLGEQGESLIDTLTPELTSTLASVNRFEARLHGCGFFPNARHARVGWVGLQPEDAFERIARVVRDVVARNGVTLDRAEFRPHLTLMRIREGWPPASIELFSKSLRDYDSAPFQVSEVTLYSSRLDPKGAVHTPLRTFALASLAQS